MRWILDDKGNHIKRPFLFEWTQMYHSDNGATDENLEDSEDIKHLKKQIERHLRILDMTLESLIELKSKLDSARLQLLQ
ncbi:hypothetical protein N7493_005914 [Penicillium malachiteum]|uniref:Uncharacterized protein n=1 Tax=Penicillium malachiteum TaxID=1324776 RepID=A0AAD6HLA9_9EURO|nr:hypothetical protein N7493_005914 [Penicillium malachiteum]